jgi:hypothetical protein
MKKIIFAFSCVFLMNGVAVADGRYEIVRLDNQGRSFIIVDTKQGKIKTCQLNKCFPWKSWGK